MIKKMNKRLERSIIIKNKEKELKKTGEKIKDN
jgi:hypothetical protein